MTDMMNSPQRKGAARGLKNWRPWTLAAVSVIALGGGIAYAVRPLAGSSIGNQASATYTDSSNQQRIATSNLVLTTVQQVAALDLTDPQTLPGAIGAPRTFSHTLTNTGNGPDSYTINLTNAPGDNFDFNSLAVYLDEGCDGLADNANNLIGQTVGPLAPGAKVCLIASGVVPLTATNGQQGFLDLTATSVFNNTIFDSNRDTVNVTSQAIINVTKSIDVGTGNPGTGPYTYTLTYSNIGNANATDVMLADVIPAGMTYVAGSGRAAVTGTTALTDLNNTDAQGTAPNQVTYDFGVTEAGRIHAKISQVAPGQSGTITFQVMVPAGTQAGTINNTAQVCYNDGAAQQPTGCTPTTVDDTGLPSNTVPFVVKPVPSVVATDNGSTTDADGLNDIVSVPSAPEGGIVTFDNVITNNSNTLDTYNITLSPDATNPFPAGTNFVIFQADGVSPLLDSNGDAIPDTGPLAPGASYHVIVKVFLPNDVPGTGPFAYVKKATSVLDPTVFDTVKDQLQAIAQSTVDVTNDIALPAATAADGAGAGPEVAPVRTKTANPGQTATFTLKINNTSAVSNSYNLQASTDSTFGSVNLPAGWSLLFYADGGAGNCSTLGAAVGNSGAVPANSNVTICAVASIPMTGAGAMPGNYELFFRARASSGAFDVKHDRVTINQVRQLAITDNQAQEVFPNGTVVYGHIIRNNGNVVEGDGTGSDTALAVNLSGVTTGWSAVVYWDKNNDGVLDANDPVVDSLEDLVGGTGGASTGAGLDPGESARLFVKVFAPASAPGDVNVATISATTVNDTFTSPAPAVVSNDDNTTLVGGNLILNKRQALDANCDGTIDAGSYSETNISALPGACILYEITVRNAGNASATSIVLSDATPPNTTLHGGAAQTCASTNGSARPATTQGTVTSPANCATGSLSAAVGTLNPTQSATLTFGVRIDP